MGGSKMRTANCELANPKMRTQFSMQSHCCCSVIGRSHPPTPLMPLFIIMTVMISGHHEYRKHSKHHHKHDGAVEGSLAHDIEEQQ